MYEICSRTHEQFFYFLQKIIIAKSESKKFNQDDVDKSEMFIAYIVPQFSGSDFAQCIFHKHAENKHYKDNGFSVQSNLIFTWGGRPTRTQGSGKIMILRAGGAH